MRARYAEVFRRKTREQWTDLLAADDTCVAPVLEFDELEQHPQNAERKTYCRVEGVLQASPAPRLQRTPAPMPTAAQAAGGATRAVLGELGYSDAEIDALADAGALC